MAFSIEECMEKAEKWAVQAEQAETADSISARCQLGALWLGLAGVKHAQEALEKLE